MPEALKETVLQYRNRILYFRLTYFSHTTLTGTIAFKLIFVDGTIPKNLEKILEQSLEQAQICVS